MSKTLTAIVMTAALGLGMLTGCSGRVTEKQLSDIMHETAAVVKKEYMASYTTRHHRHIGRVNHSYTINHPEKNRIVFDGNIDFDIDNKAVYGRFNEGDKADVSYREVYKLTFQDKDEDGIKELTETVTAGYEFVDAQPIKK